MLALCAAAAAALRFYAIDRLPGINGDEPQYAVHAHSFFQGAPLSSLRTGSDLPMNPLFFGTVLVLQKLLPSTLYTLRLSAALLSLATMLFAFWLFRSRGPMFAGTFALLVAVLPLHVGYARFAWDPTAIPTASVLALAAAVHLRPLWCIAALGLCQSVHPTTVIWVPTLLLPFVVTHWPHAALQRFRWSARHTFMAIGVLSVLTVAGLVVASVGVARVLPRAVVSELSGDFLHQVWQRARDPRELWKFVVLYLDLLSGTTIYRYIIGSMPLAAARLHAWVAAGLVLPLVAAGLRSGVTRRRRLDLTIAAGLGLSILSEYLLAGPRALSPNTERYAVCLTVPSCYVLSACVDALARTTARARMLRAAVSGVGFALLLSFNSYYLQGLKHPDPARENTFRTGPREPKELALDAIKARRDPSRTALVLVEDWWIYWTLRYLAPPETGIRVSIYRERWDYRFPRDYEPPPFDRERIQLFGVAWADHGTDNVFASQADEQVEIFGYEPGPILRVHALHALPGTKRSKRNKR
jgi:hypothetical protein